MTLPRMSLSTLMVLEIPIVAATKPCFCTVEIQGLVVVSVGISSSGMHSLFDHPKSTSMLEEFSSSFWTSFVLALILLVA